MEASAAMGPAAGACSEAGWMHETGVSVLLFVLGYVLFHPRVQIGQCFLTLLHCQAATLTPSHEAHRARGPVLLHAGTADAEAQRVAAKEEKPTESPIGAPRSGGSGRLADAAANAADDATGA
eukprot:CAMPEP_0197913298 /NCGR_PEP_ID=MMETSP1439-20131203/76403_1 /TAXON_ID=66791 /ORGANISM="Gonyaulax spinifera, Strain CCMP409" /LENGTH=122 /DNA_ID=CAMNT_0043535151 /DNA_START=206 /DNA_END=570 /DNA_ORIENTATION=+